MLNLVLLLIFIICVAALWFQGLWSNVVTLINLLLAMMLAFNYFEPVAELLDGVRAVLHLPVGLRRIVGAVRAFVRPVAGDDRHCCRARGWHSTSGWRRSGARISAVWIAWLFIGFTLRDDAHGPLGPASAGISANSQCGQFPGYGTRPSVAGVHAEPVPRSLVAGGVGSGQVVSPGGGQECPACGFSTRRADSS